MKINKTTITTEIVVLLDMYKFILNKVHLFDIMFLGTFNSWVEPKLLDEGRREYEQEGFFNSISSNNYLPFTILTIYSINIKEIHLTQQ